MKDLRILFVVLAIGLMSNPTCPCHGPGPRAVGEVAEQNKDWAGNKQGIKASKTEGLNHLEGEDEEINSKPTDLTIYEEEAILKLMDEQELGLELGENYEFVP